jgi:putative DNA primase/helicase
VILSAEDDPGDTIMPRLLAANADPRLVIGIDVREVLAGGMIVRGLLRLPDDVPALSAQLAGGDVRLVVFDPIVSFFSGAYSTLSNQDVRNALAPLRTLAEDYGVAVIAIIHLNKASEVREWSARIGESHGFQAFARSILALGPDPDDEDGEAGSKKVMVLQKSSLAKRINTGWRLEIRDVRVDDAAGAPIPTSRIDFVGRCDVNPEDLLLNDSQRDTFHAAREFVEEFLADGWRRVGELEAQAIKLGLSQRTLQRVRKDLCQRAKEPGTPHGPWWVALKTAQPFRGHSSGGVGDLDSDRNSDTANTAKTARTMADAKLGGVDNDAKTANSAKSASNVAYLRERDRRLGEQWDDE